MKRLFALLCLQFASHIPTVYGDNIINKKESIEEIKHLLKQIRQNLDGIYEELKQNH